MDIFGDFLICCWTLYFSCQHLQPQKCNPQNPGAVMMKYHLGRYFIHFNIHPPGKLGWLNMCICVNIFSCIYSTSSTLSTLISFFLAATLHIIWVLYVCCMLAKLIANLKKSSALSLTCNIVLIQELKIILFSSQGFEISHLHTHLI